ncbi:MAG TPA: hypothetical protein VJK26_01995 [Patescibacteria group bacterium]|nr:hypothetical protein [Patescibacteria group bacterium]
MGRLKKPEVEKIIKSLGHFRPSSYLRSTDELSDCRKRHMSVCEGCREKAQDQIARNLQAEKVLV